MCEKQMAQREQGLRETNTDNSNDLNRNYRVEDGEESLQIWHVGLHVERSIDNVWFPAVIVGTDQNETYSLQYEDEGIIETEVPKSEMRYYLARHLIVTAVLIDLI